MPAHEHERFMRRALELAARGAGETCPNPLVGCVLVSRGRIVGEGHHTRAGGPHAEVVALGRAGAAARGATAYVTLEPCSHTGRTPPCAPELAAAGVRRVFSALRDPNPRVDGRGLRALRSEGVAVSSGLLRREALQLNQRFVTAVRESRPYVLLKAAMTLDGRIATRSGDSKWITSPALRRQARRLRRLQDALAVGVGTALADDPLLLPEPRLRRPFLRVVFDSELRLPPGGRLASSARRSPVWVLAARNVPRRRRALEARGVRVLVGESERGRVSLSWALRALWREGVWSLMVEGGAELLGSFLAERRLDQLALFRAPLLLGGRASLGGFGGAGPERVASALAMSRCSPVSGLAGDPLLPVRDGLEVWYPIRGSGRR